MFAGSKLNCLAWSVLFIIVLILAVYFGGSFFPTYFKLGLPQVATSISADLLPTATLRANPTDSAHPTSISITANPPAVDTRVPSAATTPIRVTPLTTPAFTKIPGICGYSLDVPFGANVKFVLHKVVSGENLDMYARQYQTTMDAIRAVNYFLPLPVWEAWIVVIPVGVSDVTGMPLFEPYQADGSFTTLDELARELGADAQPLRKFNAFDDSCTRFMGWLLVPRETVTP